MHQVVSLSTTCALFKDESEEKILQNLLDRLSQKKISWDDFEKQIDDVSSFSRLNTGRNLRTLLHLAILDERFHIIDRLKHESHLKSQRDSLGLSPFDLAQLLDQKTSIQLLNPNMKFTIPDLPTDDSFEYLSHPIFETKMGLEEVIATVAKAKVGDKIPSEKIWMGIYFDKEISNGLHVPIQIHHIDDEVGYGVFAEKKISSCSFVGEYAGIIQQRTPKQLEDKKHVLRYNVWEGKKNYCIDAEHKGNFTRFINHSSKPNLGLQSVYWRGIPRMIFIALKEIKEGTQLTFDYGPLFWKKSSQVPKEFLDDF